MKFQTVKLMLVPFVICALFIQCGDNNQEDVAKADIQAESNAEGRSNINVVEIVTTHMNFIAPDEIPTGWVTFRFVNKSNMVHFAMLERLPPGKTIKDHHDQVAPVFQNILDNINGKPPSEPEAGFEPPEWFSQIVFMGGPGFISPGRNAEATVYVESGTYLIECYVKTNGIFHSYNPDPEIYGMVHQFNTREKTASTEAPEVSMEVRLSTSGGIQFQEPVSPGKHVIGVQFIDQNVYGNFVGHDIHVVRVNSDTDLSKLFDWMDWTNPAGLQTPAPAEFIGGLNEMPAGSKGYFNVDLQPGNYAFIAEVPNADSVGMFKTFSVAQPN